MQKHTLLLLSGGIGTRMQKTIPKQHLLLFGRPIIIHSLERIDKLVGVERIIITCNKNHIVELQEMIRNYGFKKEIEIIEGGKTRQESVYKGLLKVTTKSVIIHEAARPFVKFNDFEKLINSEEENISYGIGIPFTVLEGKDDFIVKNLKRSKLVNIQLPQKFETEILKLSHIKAIENQKSYTEDTSLVLDSLEVKTKILNGSEFNIKITTPIDYKIAKIIYKDYILNEE